MSSLARSLPLGNGVIMPPLPRKEHAMRSDEDGQYFNNIVSELYRVSFRLS
jgi:hypothetical protein